MPRRERPLAVTANSLDQWARKVYMPIYWQFNLEDAIIALKARQERFCRWFVELANAAAAARVDQRRTRLGGAIIDPCAS